MTRFHITGKGDAGVCKAEVRGCPLGGDADHYDSAEEARSAFEASQGAAVVAPARKQTPTEIVNAVVKKEAASGSVYLADDEREAFDEWLDGNDQWEK